MKKLALLLALVACVAVPMTLIRSADTAAAGHNARDQTPATRPAQNTRADHPASLKCQGTIPLARICAGQGIRQ